MLSRNDKSYKRRKEHLSYNDMQNLLPVMKKYLPWLMEADSQALKYACRQVDNAYQRFFKQQGGYPKYKRKRGVQSYATTNGKSVHIDDTAHKIKIPIVGWIKCRGLRLPEDGYTIQQATVTRDTDGKYYASICYKYEAIDVPDRPIQKIIGLDYKITGLYVDSNGFCPDKDKHFAKALNKLAVEQQKLSTKQGSRKGEHKSKRYLKQLVRVNKVHKRISNQRRDFLHKQSNMIAKCYDAVCIEDINIKDMYAKYGEDISNHVAEHNINHTIADDGWYMFTQMLDYKLRWQGKQLIKVAKDYPSSETCSCCGNVQDMPLHIRTYHCSKCGMILDRDINAAVNILSEGMRVLGIS